MDCIKHGLVVSLNYGTIKQIIFDESKKQLYKYKLKKYSY